MVWCGSHTLAAVPQAAEGGVNMASWQAVKEKYCDNCSNKAHCHNLCQLIYAALWDMPCEEELAKQYKINGRK